VVAVVGITRSLVLCLEQSSAYVERVMPWITVSRNFG
jgi:hypothetical protein